MSSDPSAAPGLARSSATYGSGAPIEGVARIQIRSLPDEGLVGGAVRFLLQCPHGVTSGVLLPGTKDQGRDHAVVLLAVRHRSLVRCHCEASTQGGRA